MLRVRDAPSCHSCSPPILKFSLIVLPMHSFVFSLTGLTDSCRECANNCLQYLNDLKSQANLQRADPSAIRYIVQRILAMGQDLRPKGQDVLKDELGSMVDKEMVATSTAIEEAVLRMDVKADRNNKKLYTLQQASRHVNDMAAVVVTSTKHGQQQITDHSKRISIGRIQWFHNRPFTTFGISMIN
ncbi:hypothetical protein XENOCAPTIV_013832 [Xenoophorus captivus]|uniref:Vinculin n=1 Tax=Xenoophorus captivus TaxID=1517983 RepID=A0ABV0QVK4_9TELE